MNIDPNLILNVVVLGLGALLAYIAQRNKNIITDQIAEFRKEVDEKYVPVKYDQHQHSAMSLRIAEAESEIKRNRDNIHNLANQFSTLIMGKLDRIELQIQDKVRRMANIETKLESMDGVVHDFANRILDMERDRNKSNNSARGD